jgi:pyruvate dehydrogenase E2 component (dihydrolipoamide acetyltransferase)
MATVIVMPRLSPTMEEGVLAKWTKKEGDKIAPGDVIAEVETDKANMDFPLEDEGVLLKFLVKEGDTVKLGAPVAILGEAGEDISDAMKSAAQPAGAPAKPAEKAPAPPAQTAKASEPKAVPPPKPAPVQPVMALPAPGRVGGNGHGGRVIATPFARKIAREAGVDLHAVQGSGPGGRIIAKDVQTAVSTGGAAPQLRSVPAPQIAPTAEDQLIPASQMRKTIARRLVEAKQSIPHIYLTAEATVDKLLQLREQMNELGDVKISVNDLVVKAMALALRRVPDANVSWTQDGLLKHGRVDVGVAVSLPDGLMTPVVRNADQKSLGVLSAEIRELAERARAKKLKPEEFSGGTATVSNLGMFGVKEFGAIINPPESVILAVGTTEKRPIVVERDGKDEIVVARRMALTVSCDHRTVDGVLGARLLAELVKLLEKPMSLVV